MQHDSSVNIRLNQGLAEDLSRLAQSRGQSKSEALRDILHEALGSQPNRVSADDRVLA